MGPRHSSGISRLNTLTDQLTRQRNEAIQARENERIAREAAEKAAAAANEAANAKIETARIAKEAAEAATVAAKAAAQDKANALKRAAAENAKATAEKAEVEKKAAVDRAKAKADIARVNAERSAEKEKAALEKKIVFEQSQKRFMEMKAAQAEERVVKEKEIAKIFEDKADALERWKVDHKKQTDEMEKRLTAAHRNFDQKYKEIEKDKRRIQADNKISQAEKDKQIRKLNKDSMENEKKWKAHRRVKKSRLELAKILKIPNAALARELYRAIFWKLTKNGKSECLAEVANMTLGDIEAEALKGKESEKYFTLSSDVLIYALNQMRWPKPTTGPQPPEGNHIFKSFPLDRLKVVFLGMSGTGKTTVYKRFLHILGMDKEKIKALKLRVGETGEQTVKVHHEAFDHWTGNSAKLPISLFDTPGMDGLKNAEAHEVGDKVVAFCRDNALAYMDLAFMVIRERFNDRERDIYNRISPFCHVMILRNKVDQGLRNTKIDFETENFDVGETKTEEEFFPSFKERTVQYMRDIGVNGPMYFVQANTDGCEKLWDFPKLLKDSFQHLSERFDNLLQDDPVKRAVAAASKSNGDKEIEMIRKAFPRTKKHSRDASHTQNGNPGKKIKK